MKLILALKMATAGVEALRSTVHMSLSEHVHRPNWIFQRAPRPETASEAAVAALGAKLSEDATLREMLESSLRQAKKAGRELMRPDLYAKSAGAWPSEAEDFVVHALALARWMPSRWPQTTAQPTGETADELTRRLSHLYFLVDFPVEEVARRHGRKHSEEAVADEVEAGAELDYGLMRLEYDAKLADDPWFGAWLDTYAVALGSYLDSEKSYDQGLVNDPAFHVDEAMSPDGAPTEPSGWKTVHQFLARDVKPHRPVHAPEDNTRPSSPVDGRLEEIHRLSVCSDATLPTLEPALDFFGSGAGGDDTLFDRSFVQGGNFDGAKVLRYRVPVSESHRFRAPVAGKVVRRSTTVDHLRLDVGVRDGAVVALSPSSSEGTKGYLFPRARASVVLDTQGFHEGDVGQVAVLALGLAQPIALLPDLGQTVRKGDDLGYFSVPGANQLLLFLQDRANLEVDARISGVNQFSGQSIAHRRQPKHPSFEFVLKQVVPFFLLSSLAVYAIVDFARYELHELHDILRF